MTAATVATAAAVATTPAAAAAPAAATSFGGPSAAAGLGARLTGVGVLLPTVFLGLVVLDAAGLVLLLFAGAALLSCVLVRLGVFDSEILFAVDFLAVTSDFEKDLGVSGFEVLDEDEGRVRGESAGFLAAGVDGLVTSRKTEHKNWLNAVK